MTLNTATLRHPLLAALAVASLLVLTIAQAAAEVDPDSPPPSAADSFTRANRLYDQAAGISQTESTAADQKRDEAISHYQTALAATHDPVLRARILYNIGNVRQLQGDLAGTILAYRRAAALALPTPDLMSNLELARARVAGSAAPAPANDSAPTLLNRLSPPPGTIPAVWAAFLTLFVLTWALLFARTLLPRFRPHASLPAVTAVLALACAATLAWRTWDLRTQRHDAVVTAETPPRSGPDPLVFPASSAVLIRPGAEVRVIESREGGDGQRWVRVRGRASDQPPFWLPQSAIEMVILPPSL